MPLWQRVMYVTATAAEVKVISHSIFHAKPLMKDGGLGFQLWLNGLARLQHGNRDSLLLLIDYVDMKAKNPRWDKSLIYASVFASWSDLPERRLQGAITEIASSLIQMASEAGDCQAEWEAIFRDEELNAFVRSVLHKRGFPLLLEP